MCEMHRWRAPLELAEKKLEVASVSDRGAKEKLFWVQKAVFEIGQKGDGKETFVRQAGNAARRCWPPPQQAGKLRQF